MLGSSFIQNLKRTVQSHETVYQRTRGRETVFLPYPTATCLFDALSKRNSAHAEHRFHLLRVIVLEYQHGDRPTLWLTLALRAFAPMLRSLGKRLPEGSVDEREQAMHVAFAEAVHGLRIRREGGPVFPLSTLRRAMIRALLSDRVEGDPADEVDFDEEAPECASAAHLDSPQFVRCLAAEVGGFFAQEPGGGDVALLLAGGETLAEQAERLSSEKMTAYGLEKRRHRTVARVRRQIAGGRR